ncbi:saccharopine dehydrogenase family protein [Dermacoccaceae bacterium W4C1]
MTTQRELDIVLYGATGFVGRLTADHLVRHAPEGVRIGLAGRSAAKLERVREHLGVRAAQWPIITADADDPDSLTAMAQRTAVVATTVGPYAQFGMPLVEACARVGTDYLDLTGETLFVRRSLEEFHKVALDNGARIVHGCGFDALPSDLGVLQLIQQVEADGAGTLGETTLYATMKGGFSGGTVASARGQVEQVARDPQARREIADTFALSPDRAAEPADDVRDTLSVRYAEEISSWVAPSLFSPYNSRLVRRSNALWGYRYGRDFSYQEVLRTGDGMPGRGIAHAISGALGAGMTAMAIPFLGPLIDKVVPAAGEGPSDKRRERGFFRMDIRAVTTTGAHYRSVVGAGSDPGYAATSVMLGESALALALQREACELPPGLTGGVLTPATALAPAVIDRLTARGFTFSVNRVDA